MANIRVYVPCANETVCENAKKTYAWHPWITPFVMSRNGPYMEGEAFLNDLLPRIEEWRDVEYVGILSPNAQGKIDISFMPDVCAQASKENVDVVGFLPIPDPMLIQAMRCVPRFLEIWLPLLLDLGYSPSQITDTDVPAFMCNYWLARPEWMEKYISFFKSAVERLGVLANTNPDVKNALESNSKYESKTVSQDTLRALYGTPYMQYHPFIQERLPNFYFHVHKAKLAFFGNCVRESFWVDYFRVQLNKIINMAKQHGLAVDIPM